MKIQSLAQRIKKEYQEQKGARFFSERALLSALFEKNGLDRNLPLLDPEREVEKMLEEKILSDLSLLLQGEPIQYYLGSEIFCGEEFLVSPGVLIPRPETELLVEKAAERVKKDALVFDFCCGSGCVGIALLKKREDLRCISFDLSPKALALTQKNRERFSLSDRLCIEEMDVLSHRAKEAILSLAPALVIANPPYLTGEEMTRIPENVTREPSMALFGGDDGLLFYRHFLSLCKQTGTPFLCEMGSGQQEGIEKLLEKEGLEGEFYRDFSNLPRAFFVG